jgi:two-component system, cell cycle sensor histidine kinase and response regulator CckA
MATILVVDDEKPICMLLSRLLQHEGLNVIIAESGPEAIATFRAQAGAIDLLISDVSMPGMDGLSLANELLALNPRLPVLFMSGCCEDEDALRFAGFEFLCKPFSLASFLGTVRGLLAHTESLV